MAARPRGLSAACTLRMKLVHVGGSKFLLQPSRLYKLLKAHRPKHPAPTAPAPSFSRLYPNCTATTL